MDRRGISCITFPERITLHYLWLPTVFFTTIDLKGLKDTLGHGTRFFLQPYIVPEDSSENCRAMACGALSRCSRGFANDYISMMAGSGSHTTHHLWICLVVRPHSVARF